MRSTSLPSLSLAYFTLFTYLATSSAKLTSSWKRNLHRVDLSVSILDASISSIKPLLSFGTRDGDTALDRVLKWQQCSTSVHVGHGFHASGSDTTCLTLPAEQGCSRTAATSRLSTASSCTSSVDSNRYFHGVWDKLNLTSEPGINPVREWGKFSNPFKSGANPTSAWDKSSTTSKPGTWDTLNKSDLEAFNNSVSYGISTSVFEFAIYSSFARLLRSTNSGSTIIGAFIITTTITKCQALVTQPALSVVPDVTPCQRLTSLSLGPSSTPNNTTKLSSVCSLSSTAARGLGSATSSPIQVNGPIQPSAEPTLVPTTSDRTIASFNLSSATIASSSTCATATVSSTPLTLNPIPDGGEFSISPTYPTVCSARTITYSSTKELSTGKIPISNSIGWKNAESPWTFSVGAGFEIDLLDQGSNQSTRTLGANPKPAVDNFTRNLDNSWVLTAVSNMSTIVLCFVIEPQGLITT